MTESTTLLSLSHPLLEKFIRNKKQTLIPWISKDFFPFPPLQVFSIDSPHLRTARVWHKILVCRFYYGNSTMYQRKITPCNASDYDVLLVVVGSS